MSIRSRLERRLSELAGDILPDEFRSRLTEARRALDAGGAERAAQILEALLAERPDHSGALSLMGIARLEQNQPASALSAFERALARSPEDPDSRLGKGRAQLALGDAQASVTALRSAIEASGGDRAILAGAYRGLGLAYRELGEIDKAVRELRKAVAEAPEDGDARAALAEALLASSSEAREEAERHARRVVEEEGPAPRAWIALGQTALCESPGSQAVSSFKRALEAIDEDDPAAIDLRVRALIGLGDAAIDSDPAEARAAYLEALELSPSRPDLYLRLGDALERESDATAALGALERAADLGGGLRALRRGVTAALRLDAVETAVRLANRILDEDPDDPRALVAKGIALAGDGATEAARATLSSALRAGEDADARVALGELELGEDAGREAGARAAEEARAALRLKPRAQRARELLKTARARELGPGEGARADLRTLVAGIDPLARHHAALAPLATESAKLKAELDEPLLVTVMGEFSSGKSTFVNALAGDDVAPTGITPTTATINIVKYGRERGGRIVDRRGRAEELAWEALRDRLAGLDAEGAREIAYVEILLPLPGLSRFHIVDTPGLNSILPEHEEVARDFIARADAVIWLFSAGQAGKASERRALEEVRAQGVRVLGVLNKTDQLRSRDVEELTRHVQAELGPFFEAVLPVSAYRARAAQLEGREDPAWATLTEALEARFFTRARELKRQVCARRLSGLFERMHALTEEELRRVRETAESLSAAVAELASARGEFEGDVVAAERRALAESVRELYGRAAREVLELVRPRRLPFGSHSATPADRDYLLSLLDAGFDSALQPSRARAVSALRARADAALSAAEAAREVAGEGAVRAVETAAQDAPKWVEAEAFGRARAFVRGYLRGGYVDRFFRRHLPKIELSEEAIHRALLADSPDLDAALAAPLASAGERALQQIQTEVDRLAGAAEVVAFDLEEGLLSALRAYRDSLSELRAQLGDGEEVRANASP